MNEAQAYDIISDTVLAVLLASAPVLGVALVIGLVIAFFQALTQIQEMTLTFVPKIVMIFVTLLVATPFMYGTLKSLSDTVFDLVENGGL
ncbi:flagellar biosynthesis protein FliQ [Loktanella salsilacus]|jgi:flagellar biosynthetic protein FliQ|uniref:Flagellar biosynthetic protein FliQ n=1 Tax=Loktanella salsilacus TaxID=195913 RepID=A0A1I4GHZ6_9RHOB|nr:flagellar biosynthesis protein FliQ [Loktanella salsilacus]MBU0779784.1 flagellar biosynthesis protein FliQ [Alphaproteobacteria bacterium]UTH46545.1 flagellar biosynthesis protein FliQ [Loktanella salsilacus]UTH50229.1 flagellar biosynthesis protein FliQ [Loktanella salsilacus]SFL29692.1 flagellar biosynthetic protein FliQ [Loktanella salsilacus]